MAQIIVDHRGSRVERSTWRTFAAYGSTLVSSGRLVARAGLGRLRPQSVERIKRQWAEQVLAVSHTTVGVDGAEHVDPRQGYVLVSNHRSLLDPVAAVTAFPGRLSFVAKQELARIPIFSRALTAVEVVYVDRRDPVRAKQQLEEAKANVAGGISMWVAAEGTRSRDGELARFKKGGFHVALALGVPILPTWIDGTGEILPPDSLRCVTGQTVWVLFAPPIPTAGVDRSALPDLVSRTREALLALRERATELRAAG